MTLHRGYPLTAVTMYRTYLLQDTMFNYFAKFVLFVCQNVAYISWWRCISHEGVLSDQEWWWSTQFLLGLSAITINIYNNFVWAFHTWSIGHVLLYPKRIVQCSLILLLVQTHAHRPSAFHISHRLLHIRPSAFYITSQAIGYYISFLDIAGLIASFCF